MTDIGQPIENRPDNLPLVAGARTATTLLRQRAMYDWRSRPAIEIPGQAERYWTWPSRGCIGR